MAKRNDSKSSSETQQWKTMLDSMSNTLQIIASDRQMYRDRLVSDAILYNEKISQLESEITTLEKIQMVDTLSSDLLLFMKKKDAFIYKARLDSTCGDLKDLKAAFDCIIKPLQDSDAAKISALVSEKNFIWNQYKNLEEKLNSKKLEIELANEEISRLREDSEQLSSSNVQKDSTIQRLKSDVDKLEAALVEKSKEIELLRNGSITPSLRGCTVTNKCNDNRNNNNMGKIETSSSRTHEKGTRSLKRKATDSIPISGTHQLFTSSFKVPKLKNPSPRVN